MKIWLDPLTPKHVIFFDYMIKRLEKNHQILITSRNYREASEVAKIRKLKAKVVGKHGGGDLFNKLEASTKRILELSKIVRKFSPDVSISFCSPEASRISFGLGIKHIAFSNFPFINATMRLSLPLSYKLLAPKHISKKEYTKFGINEKDIVQYNALDEYIIIKGESFTSTLPKLKLKQKQTILFRTVQTQASEGIGHKTVDTIPIIKRLAKEFPDYNLIVLGRYFEQIKMLKENLKGSNITVLNKVVDSAEILSITDVFVGSGGTMTSEAALRGIPTISYNAIPMPDEQYLVKRGFVYRGTSPNEIVKLLRKLEKTDKKKLKSRAKKFLDAMEDPYTKLVPILKELKKDSS